MNSYENTVTSKPHTLHSQFNQWMELVTAGQRHVADLDTILGLARFGNGVFYTLENVR